MTKALEGSCLSPVSGDFPSPLPLAHRDGYLHVPSNSRLPCGVTEGAGLATQRAVFLDRDGVLVEDVHYLTSPDQLKLLPGVAGALRGLQSRFSIIVVTNQSGIARGVLTEKDLMTIHAELVRLLAAEEAMVDALYYCPHLPEAAVPPYRINCTCRKPGPGMLLRAASDWGIDLSESFLVGDMPRDIQAADAAGVRSILLRKACAVPYSRAAVARDLLEATSLILTANEAPDPILTPTLPAPDQQSLPSRSYNEN